MGRDERREAGGLIWTVAAGPGESQRVRSRVVEVSAGIVWMGIQPS